jgi:hypothetical protein
LNAVLLAALSTLAAGQTVTLELVKAHGEVEEGILGGLEVFGGHSVLVEEAEIELGDEFRVIVGVEVARVDEDHGFATVGAEGRRVWWAHGGSFV